MQSLYLETRGWLHAWRPGLKLGLVAVLGTVVFLIDHPGWLLGVAMLAGLLVLAPITVAAGRWLRAR